MISHRQRPDCAPGLCKEHRREELVSRAPAQLMMLGAMALIAAAIYFRTPTAMLLGALGGLVLPQFAMAYAIARPKLLTAVHCDRGHIWLAGVSATVLDQAQGIAQPADNLNVKPSA